MTSGPRVDLTSKINDAFARHGGGYLAEAEAIYCEVLHIEPEHFDALQLLGHVRFQQRRYDEALDLIGRALQIKPDFHAALTNYGWSLFYLGRREEGLRYLDRAIESKPDHAPYVLARGEAARRMNKLDEALRYFRVAQAIDRTNADAHYWEGLTDLLAGNFAQGFAKYEWRHAAPQLRSIPQYNRPKWLGHFTIEGKTILLHPEQGFGDTIQFLRYASELSKRGARVILAATDRLAALCRRMPSIERVVLNGEPQPQFDTWCPIASLPLACGTTIDTIPALVPYLAADQVKTDFWRRRLDNRRHQVGLVWSGSPQNMEDAARSMPLATLRGLILGAPNVQFVSLQNDVRPDDRDVLNDLPVLVLGPMLIDFDEVAGVIQNLDLVITVDTSFAHLAGALGKPVWVLLHDHPDWRWLLGRDDSPWYPTAWLFRQPRPGDWSAVAAKVAAELAAFLSPVPASGERQV